MGATDTNVIAIFLHSDRKKPVLNNAFTADIQEWCKELQIKEAHGGKNHGYHVTLSAILSFFDIYIKNTFYIIGSQSMTE